MNQSFITPTNITLFIMCIWLAAITIIFIKIQKQLKEITKGVSKKDLKSILNDISASIKQSESNTQKIEDQIKKLKTSIRSHLQKVSLVRFNPFLDTGGNQSFSLCLLDEDNNGIVITSLHSRDSTRIYVKEIIKGASDGRELSKEEHQALKEALKKK